MGWGRWAYCFGMWLAPAAMLAQHLVRPERVADAERFLDAKADEQPLRCAAGPLPPMLNFSFRFQAGYAVRVPMSQYSGAGHGWAVLVRVTPEGGDRKPVYLASSYRLPPVPKTKYEFAISGAYLLGIGQYAVDWAMVDDKDRVCRKSWRVTVALNHSQRQVKPAMAPNTVGALSFVKWSQAEASDDLRPLRLTVLMHAAPILRTMTRIRGRDQSRLLGSLVALLERVPAVSVRVVAFNLDQQREVFRSEHFDSAGFEKLAETLQEIELGTVDYKVLKNTTGKVDLLADLVNQELDAKERSDAVVFLGPAQRYVERVPEDAIAEAGAGAPRFFYFEYHSYRDAGSEFPDTIENVVKKLGGKVSKIHTPGEFAKAITVLEERVAADSFRR